MIVDKKLLTTKLNGMFSQLEKKGIRAEDFASQLKVSYSTVKAWMSGRRYPKVATIKQIESQFEVKIL